MSYPPSGPQMPYGPPPPPQPPKQGMSTGAKIGIGCGGCAGLLIILFMFAGCVSLLTGNSLSDPPAAVVPTEEERGEGAAAEQTDEPAEEGAQEDGIVLAASHAGTAGDAIDDTVYTVIDVTVENNSSEEIDVNPIFFSAVLDDGTVVNDWGESLFADIDQISVVTLGPGQRTEGQMALVGEDLDVVEVRMSELFGSGDPIVAEVR